ncbi:uncharacterized protein LOC144448021 [Glandiceps talaboti]
MAVKARKKLAIVGKSVKDLKFLAPKIYFRLFDVLILPVLSYGSEVWGFMAYEHLERVQLLYCRRYLGVANSAPNCTVLGECGRLPSFCYYVTRCVKYWLHIITMPESRLPFKAYQMLFKMDEQGKHSWVTQVKHLFYQYGFGESCLNQGVGNTVVFLSEFSTRVKDVKSQEWWSEVCANEKTSYYRNFKKELAPEMYISLISLCKYRRALARFRCSSHALEIETGRHRGTDREFRICKLCCIEVEDEYHFLFKCPAWDNLRKRYLQPASYRSPSLYHVNQLMASRDGNTTRNLALFLFHAFKVKDKL